MSRRIDLVVVHCSDSPFGSAALIEAWHRARGFAGLGYHWVILNGYPDADSHRLRRPRFDLDGVAQPGRPLNEPGAHARGHNAHSAGICLVGRDQFTQAQFETLTRLVREIRRDHPGARLVGHYELLRPGDPPKSCPNLDMDYLRGLMGEV